MESSKSKIETVKPARKVIPHSAKGRRKFAAFLIVGLARLLMKTWRVEWDDRSELFKGTRGPLIFCIWHNRLACSMLIYHDYVKERRPSEGLAAMISASKDGGLLAAVLDKFEVEAVRGSSSRRGPQALLEATSWAEKGYHIAITPDGPRGPRYEIQDGIIALAQITGLQIVPVSIAIKGKISTRSWDRFQIPLPFARCRVFLGEPISVPRNLPDAERENVRLQLQQTMMLLTTD